MESDPFELNDGQLKAMYNLKTLEPHQSWADDSTSHLDMSRWQEDATLLEERPYEFLREVMYEERQCLKEGGSIEASQDLAQRAMRVRDPLNGKHILEALEALQIGNNQRPRYLVNDKHFDDKVFLRDLHKRDSFEDLSRALDRLDRDLQEQQGDLRELVAQNFTQYVHIKNRLDRIYKGFNEKFGKTDDSPNSLINDLQDRVDESVRVTTQKLKPLLEYSDLLNNYQKTKQFIEDNRQFFNLPKILRRCLEDGNYSEFLIEYSKGKELYQEITLTSASPKEIGKEPSKELMYLTNNSLVSLNNSQQIPKVIQAVWLKVSQILSDYKSNLWDILLQKQNETDIMMIANKSVNTSHSISSSHFISIISKLIDLSIDESPIEKWINSRMDDLETHVTDTANNMLMKIIQQQALIVTNNHHKTALSNDDFTIIDVDLLYYTNITQLFHETRAQEIEDTLASGTEVNADIQNLTGGQSLPDSSSIVEMWLLILSYVTQLQNICKSFIQTWEHVEKFLDGTYQNILINDKRKENILFINNYDLNNYESILILNDEQKKNIRSRAESFISLLSAKLISFFQASQKTLSSSNTNAIDNGIIDMTKDAGNPEDYGFLPPHANGLSCLRYLSRIVEPILHFNTQLAQLAISSNCTDTIRKVTNIVIERSIGAIYSTRLRDISNFHLLENWEISQMVNKNSDERLEYGITQFPQIVTAFQKYSLATIHRILFAFERIPASNGVAILNYPSRSLLTGVEVQQIISMEAVLESILKIATKDKDNPRNPHTILILTNLQHIREETFPKIINFFDESFRWNLKSKNLEIFNLLGKMESSIFGNYLSDLKIELRDVLEEKFYEIDWPTYTSNSFRIGDYIIEALMVLITVHSECYRIGPQLINNILTETQVFISRYLFESFKPYIGNFSSDGLLQMTVDLIYFQKVLGNFLEKDTAITLRATLQNCFQNNDDRLDRCIREVSPIVEANLSRTSVQFAAFK